MGERFLGYVRSNELARHGNGYTRHPMVAEMPPAKTVNNPAKKPGDRPELVEVPRWMVTDAYLAEGSQSGVNEVDFVKDRLGIPDLKTMSPEEKKALFEEIFGEDTAETGIAFAREFQDFRERELASAASGLNEFDRFSGMCECSLLLQGIVQPYSTKGTVQRLARLAGFRENERGARMSFKESGEDQQVTLSPIRYSTARILAGFFGPTQPAEGHTPRIFHVADLARGLAPHNLFVYSASSSPVELARAAHLYTLNVASAEFHFRVGREEAELDPATRSSGDQLQELTAGFLASL